MSPIRFIQRMDCDNPRIKPFLHIPHMWIMADLFVCGLLPFRLLLFLLSSGRRRCDRANLDFQSHRPAEVLFQRSLDTLLNGFVQHLSVARLQGQPESIAIPFRQGAIQRHLFGDARQGQLRHQGAPF